MSLKITLIHPSRGRAKKASETFLHWMESAHDTNNINRILSIDESDEDKEKYFEFNEDAYTKIIVNDNDSVVQATNAAAKISKGDILIYLSDDFSCPEGWDNLLIEKFEQIETPALLKVDDCLVGFYIEVLTIPIMNRALYEKLGYFWHPGYKSMFVDEDLYHTCNQWLRFAPELKFPHLHCTIGKAEHDETYKRSEKNWDSGKAFYAERKNLNFPL